MNACGYTGQERYILLLIVSDNPHLTYKLFSLSIFYGTIYIGKDGN